MDFQTKAIKGIKAHDLPYNAVVPPIFLASTFALDSIDIEPPYGYQRSKNPTTAAFEELFCELEGCKYCYATSTGMAATTLAFSLLKTGDKVLCNSNIYGGTYRYMSNIFPQYGIQYEMCENLNALDELPSGTSAVFIETPSNPLLKVCDVEKIVKLAKKRGALVIADNTFMTPYYQKLFDFGVDVVVYSATKYIGGHADVLAGIVCCNNDEIGERLKLLKNTLGCPLAPFDSYSLIRGIKTMALRLEAQNSNTRQIADFLQGHSAVEQVFFAGAQNEYEKALQEKQAKGALGGVLSVKLKPNYNYKTFAHSLELFDLAVSLGGVESLICQPATMTHESYPKALQEQIGITPDLLRLAIGIESASDLIADLDSALNAAKK